MTESVLRHTEPVEYGRWLTGQGLELAADNRAWMSWNLLLAAVPAVLAVALFRHRGRRGGTWWAGLVAFILFLPNAPYVLTDLVHLRADVAAAPTDAVVVFAVLPLYSAFIAAGFLAYGLAVAEVGSFLDRHGLGDRRGAIELGLHLVSAVGIVLGRIARLNSWDTVTTPVGTVERSLTTLSWRWAPVAIAVMFVAVWVGHAVTRSLVRSARAWSASHLPLR